MKTKLPTLRHLRKTLPMLGLLLLSVLGTGKAWAQDYSGTYYIAMPGKGSYTPGDPSSNYYLVPTRNWCFFVAPNGVQADNNGQPFLTTYKCGHVDDAKWTIQKHATEDYYYIIHVADGKYLTYNETLTGSSDNRVRVHLEASITGDNNLFSITATTAGGVTNYFISSKTDAGQYLNVTDGNKDSYAGASGKTDGPTGYNNVGGIIGRWNEANNTSQFRFEEMASIDAPSITNNNDGTFTITAATGATIYYTTDGTVPTMSSYTGTGTTPVNVIQTESMTVIKAIAKVASDAVPTDVTTYELPECAPPVISFDHATSLVSIASATTGSTIYYTTDGGTPTASSTGYVSPFTVTSPTTVKAVATKLGYASSSVTTLTISQVATPTIQNNGSNAISITTTTDGATIHYTIDGSTPTTSSTEYIEPLTDNVSNVVIKAIAVKENMIASEVGSGSVILRCATPVITRVGMTFTLSCSMPTDATLYYTLGGGSEVEYPGTPVPVTVDQLPITVTAVARHSDYTESETASVLLKNGDGTPESPYMILNVSDFANFVNGVNDGTASSACYKLGADISASGIDAITEEFIGTFDGDGHTISNLGHALFSSVNGGTVKNVFLDAVSISDGTNAGAIANQVTGTSENMASVYNCGVLSGSVSGSGKVGGIVGQLGSSNNDNCYARVVNCFSYATVSGGNDVGGIVGYNDFASTATDIRTMVMNCMFYGDITGGTNVSPVYGGDNINNLHGGLNTYNYYAYSQLTTATINKYNCALAVEDKYLTRFEFYRLLLNSNKKLAAFYATGSADNADQKMLKWVLETADRTIATPKPYPVLKAQGYYPSIVNPDVDNAPDSAIVGRNHGGRLGKTLSVTISSVGSNAPTEASITNGSLTLQRTDKDFDRFNYNYDKVQLPYYNDVGTGNYTENRVVTGWKITAIEGGTAGTYTAADAWGGYNFADRKCTNKDKFSVSGRVFSQGAYFDVPYGVTSITIEPYWGKAAYVSDLHLDVVGSTDYTAQNVTRLAKTYGDNGVNVSINGSTQQVYSSIGNALGQLTGVADPTVYDYAVVLVGNVHQGAVPSQGINPFTIMSIDLDNDHEPDCSLIYHHIGKKRIAPIRFDFLNMPGTAQAQKPNGATLVCNIAIIHPSAWFEITNSALLYFSQLEYEDLVDNAARANGPLILQGGIFDQFVSTNNTAVNGKTIYMHLGGNVWFQEFNMGTHSDGNKSTPHPPVSVTGGEYVGFYLTGTYNQDAAVRTDNAECYISGGHFIEAAGTGQEAINGDVRWQIYNADIDNFFGGGTNGATGKNIKGNVTVDIFNSHVTTFCGGPKFGNMEPEKKVTTNAEGCVFGTYFGAGYGGTAYSRKKYYDKDGTPPWGTTLQSYYTTDRGNYFDGVATELKQGNVSYGYKGIGVATDFDYETFVWSSVKTGGRFFVKFASFSLAQCNDVESNLKNCIVIGNFYGGGSLGKVIGDVTSELDGCTVKGNVYGAGYSATLPTIQVRDGGFTEVPSYNSASGMFEPGVFSNTTDFMWKNATESGVSLSNGNSGSDLTNHYIYTDVDLDNLGSVRGASLILKGNTVVGTEGDAETGSVFGGGEESAVNNNTIVKLKGNTHVLGNVYGGGNKGSVGGNSKVVIED